MLFDRDELALEILLTGNGPGCAEDARRAYQIADAMIAENRSNAMLLDMLRQIDQKLDHQHEMLHVHGRILTGIAAAVKKLEPGIDPELAAALLESQKHHDALKAALDAQPPAPAA